MKKLIVLMLALCLLLCACQKKQETAATTEPTTAPTAAPTEPVTEAPTEPEVPEEPAVIRHPLNGAVLETPYTGRPTAVVISNDSDALPQHGISQADFIFEAETEGGITRLLVVFSDVSSVEGKIGPIRSARSFLNSLAYSMDAPIMHCGGSEWGINGFIDNANRVKPWAHINQQNNGSYFYRDPERSSYLSWLNLFTNGEMLHKGLEDKGYLPTGDVATDYGLQFGEEVNLNGETANKVTVNFRGSKTTVMNYDAETGLYSAREYGRDHIDGNTGNALTYNNVLCLYTEQTGIYDGTYTRSFYKLVGEGTGHCAINGTIVPIKWSRAEATDFFTFTLEDGTPLTLNVGKTYVGIAADTVTVSYE